MGKELIGITDGQVPWKMPGVIRESADLGSLPGTIVSFARIWLSLPWMFNSPPPDRER